MMANLGVGSDPRESSLELLGREAACAGRSKRAAQNPELGVAICYHSVTAWKQASSKPHPEYPPRPWVLAQNFREWTCKHPDTFLLLMPAWPGLLSGACDWGHQEPFSAGLLTFPGEAGPVGITENRLRSTDFINYCKLGNMLYWFSS